MTTPHAVPRHVARAVMSLLVACLFGCSDPPASGDGSGGNLNLGGAIANAGQGGIAAAQGGSSSAGSKAGASSGGASGSSGGALGGASAGGTGTSRCPSKGGAMVRLPEGYCIDVTEVSEAQYADWLATSPDVDAQDSATCGWNISFAPRFPASEMGTEAIGVDWCDANAYCSAMGKRLCGALGGRALANTEYTSATANEWFSACTSHGQFVSSCTDQTSTKCCATNEVVVHYSVGSLKTCQSSDPGYAGVFDLVGDISEWLNSCDDGVGENAQCATQGGDLATARVPARLRPGRRIART